MIIRLLKASLLSLVLCGNILGHTGKPDHHVIIDTDGAHDDMRAITLLLAGDNIRTLAITCSQGSLYPDSVYVKVKSLLSTFHHEGIPVGIGEQNGKKLPEWSDFAQGISWGNPPVPGSPDFQEAAGPLLSSVIEKYGLKVTLIALGSLKTYADWLRQYPALTGKIDRIIWYNNHTPEEGFNYQASPKSYNYILQTGVPLYIVSNPIDQLLIDKDYEEIINEAGSLYARHISQMHRQPDVADRIREKHLLIWDDLIPVYLEAPILFEIKGEGIPYYVSPINGVPVRAVYALMRQMLGSSSGVYSRVFSAFPVDPELYKPDYSRILAETLEAYGAAEWKAISMTNEIHGHTGIYSIIGAKMGMRAMEYFNVGINNMTVTTFAGNRPPLSCLNDGIQISTGCTIGQGLIDVSDSISPIPSAVFEFNNRKVHISLKPNIVRDMQNAVRYGVDTFGLQSVDYWDYIENLAIHYWSRFSRYEIFEMKEIRETIESR